MTDLQIFSLIVFLFSIISAPIIDHFFFTKYFKVAQGNDTLIKNRKEEIKGTSFSIPSILKNELSEEEWETVESKSEGSAPTNKHSKEAEVSAKIIANELKKFYSVDSKFNRFLTTIIIDELYDKYKNSPSSFFSPKSAIKSYLETIIDEKSLQKKKEDPEVNK